MDSLHDVALMVLVAVAAVALVFVTRARRRSYESNARTLAEENVCEHLRPALELLLSRGHQVTRVGQRHPELPMEIHVLPEFDPKGLIDELKLGEPVFLSDERNVMFCKEDWCEIHPRR